MKKVKMLAIGALVGTSFVAGSMMAPVATVAEPGSSDDPAVAKSLFNQELGKVRSEATTLKNTVTTLQNTVKTLESKVKALESGTGGSTGGGSTGGGSTTPPETSIGTGTVTADSLNIRSGPSTSNSVIGKVTKGKTVTLLAKSGTWYKIQYGSVVGYVSGDYLSVKLNSSSGGGTSTTKKGTVNCASLNVRSGAGTNYSIVGKLSKGTSVTIDSTSGSWYKITSGSVKGYVSKEYITVK